MMGPQVKQYKGNARPAALEEIAGQVWAARPFFPLHLLKNTSSAIDLRPGASGVFP